jgi:hypothetical protein
MTMTNEQKLKRAKEQMHSVSRSQLITHLSDFFYANFTASAINSLAQASAYIETVVSTFENHASNQAFVDSTIYYPYSDDLRIRNEKGDLSIRETIIAMQLLVAGTFIRDELTLNANFFDNVEQSIRTVLLTQFGANVVLPLQYDNAKSQYRDILDPIDYTQTPYKGLDLSYNRDADINQRLSINQLLYSDIEQRRSPEKELITYIATYLAEFYHLQQTHACKQVLATFFANKDFTEIDMTAMKKLHLNVMWSQLPELEAA